MSFYYILTLLCCFHLRIRSVEILFVFYRGAHLRDAGHLKEHLSLKEKLSFLKCCFNNYGTLKPCCILYCNINANMIIRISKEGNIMV